MYASRNPPEEPPCFEGNEATNWIPCKTILMPENKDAGEIYMMVRNQTITRFNGQYDVPVGLDHNAVWNMIDHWPTKIKDPMECFSRVISTFHHFLKEERDDEN